jgi:tRNA-splicing ligase RtcB
MFELYGKYNSAKIFTDICENEAQSQIIELLNQEMDSSSSIRIMPDVHAGAGCTIGTTMTLKDKVIPNLVGVDIGCGMEVVELGLDADAIDFDRLDETIRKFIPSGCSIRSTALSKATEGEVSKLHCVSAIDIERACKSIGTLGGGNHFIELDTDSKGKVYIVIHSGSRHLGVEIAK